MFDLSWCLRPGGYRFSSRVSFYGSLGKVFYLRMAGATLEDIMAPAGVVLPCFCFRPCGAQQRRGGAR